MNYVPVFNADGRLTRDGLVQRFDPRLRIVATAGFALVAVSLHSLEPLTALLGVSLCLALAARLPFGPTARRLAALDAFMAVVLITLPFSMAGTEFFRIGPLAASWEGVFRAVEIILKANAVMLTVLALAGTLEVVTVGHALAALGISRKLVHLLLLTVRYIGALRDQYAQLRDAMRVRAFRMTVSWHAWRSLGWLFGMVMVRSAERAERVLDAMKCRGYRGELHVLAEMRLTAADWLAGAVFLGLLILIATWGYTWGHTWGYGG